MKYTLLYIFAAIGMLTMASCSHDDDDAAPVSEAKQDAQNVKSYTPVSWIANAYTPEDLKEVEDAVGAIRGAGYTYRDNESYCVGTDMEVFNMRNLRDMERKYRTS